MTRLDTRAPDCTIRLALESNKSIECAAPADITRQTTDAIVNAANPSLLGGGGVDGAIHRSGGDAILAECRQIVSKIGALPAGKAILTTGRKLAARHVIHTVGPIYRGGRNGEAEILASVIESRFALPMSTPSNHYPSRRFQRERSDIPLPKRRRSRLRPPSRLWPLLITSGRSASFSLTWLRCEPIPKPPKVSFLPAPRIHFESKRPPHEKEADCRQLEDVQDPRSDPRVFPRLSAAGFRTRAR